MQLPNGYTDIPPGKLVTVVTSLEMLAPASSRPAPPGPWTVRHVEPPQLDWYRDIYDRIGRDWLWVSRLKMSDADLVVILHDPAVQVYALVANGRDEGLLELDFRAPGDCELAFFGVTPAFVGTGAGRFLINRAIEIAWSRPIRRFWVHTCTLDHPAALAFYRRSGFRAFRRQVEVMDDPRLSGLSQRDAAPQIPLIGT
jgi:GNAT superfamily N-acetyltransferase